MAKSAKKRKTKTADFQKTRLKVGKGKAPPSNATNTNAQVRDLQLLQQFNHVESDLNSERPIKQLFNNLKNGAHEVRAAALAGIKDAIQKSPSGGAKYLGLDM